MEIQDWMECLTARDIMQEQLITVKPRDKLRDAAALLVDSGISALPVVDDSRICVGLISATDVVRAERRRDDRKASLRPEPEQTVEMYMTHEIIAVRADHPLSLAVHLMVDRQVHRVLVLDESQQLCGLVSTTDVLHALARAEQAALEHRDRVVSRLNVS